MSDTNSRLRIAENWRAVVEEVRQAAASTGRDPAGIQIIGVSKYVDAATTGALVDAGCTDLGESRPQQLWQKAEFLPLAGRVRWHLIGHLQTNKVRRTLRCHPVIHSVDSDRLLQKIDDEARAQQIEVPVLVEVNVSGDPAKTGLSPDMVEALLDDFPVPPEPAGGARVCGLMAMAGWGTRPTEARHQFADARELRDHLQMKSGVPLPELSMGMSGDFAAAIAEGATMVRIGSRLFEGILEGPEHRK